MRYSFLGLAALLAVSLTCCGSANSGAAKNGSTSSRRSSTDVVSHGFEHGLNGFSLAGVGEVDPTIVSGPARTGTHSARFQVRGSEDRSELILGGQGTGSSAGIIHFHDGENYWYGFSFQILDMTWGHPGAHNLIMQLFSESYGPNFGLQLWNYQGKKGLYTHGLAMGGDRYLAPVSPHRWYDVQIHLGMSNEGHGFYAVYLDGRKVDSRKGVSTIHPSDPFAYIKTGLYRNGTTNPGTSTLLVDSVKLGHSRRSVEPE